MPRCLLAATALAASLLGGAHGCTTIIAAPGAAKGGGTLVTHNADCFNCDFRFAKIEPRLSSQLYTVFRYRPQYPTEVSGSSSTWSAGNLDDTLAQRDTWASAAWNDLQTLAVLSLDELLDEAGVVGDVPRGGAEFAYVDALYGYSNDQGLGLGESTCEARYPGLSPPTRQGGEGPLWDVSALSRVAMARCATARCAVRLIGRLAEARGYYTPDPAMPAEWGEALTLADGAEAWVLHILPDQTGMSALWAAQRVPDGHIAAVANEFTIRALPTTADDGADGALGDGAEFMASRGLFDAAADGGFGVYLDGGAALDFTATFGPNLNAASAGGSKYPDTSPYSTRRVWRVFSLAAPSRLGAPPLANESTALPADGVMSRLGDPLPFSIRPDGPLGARDLMGMMRDFYEGTPYDLTQVRRLFHCDSPSFSLLLSHSPLRSPSLSVAFRRSPPASFYRLLPLISPSLFVSFRRSPSLSFSLLLSLSAWFCDL